MAYKRKNNRPPRPGEGAPRQFKSVQEMRLAIEGYFNWCRDEVRPITMTGLANSLDLSRQGLINYAGRPEFVDTIKRAKRRVEQFAEESLYTLKNPAGTIFNLVNNHEKWKNKQQVDLGIGDELLEKYKDLTPDQIQERVDELTGRSKRTPLTS